MTARLLAVALLFSLLVGVPLAGTPASARQDDQLQIAFSVPGLNFPFFVHMMNIARDRAAELDIELIELDGQDNSATQSAGIETMIAQGVDGIVISPKDVEALAPAIQAATDAGIPVVTVDRNVTGAQRWPPRASSGAILDGRRGWGGETRVHRWGGSGGRGRGAAERVCGP
jgi:ABC-type sugar transport system substrate-binding protein